MRWISFLLCLLPCLAFAKPVPQKGPKPLELKRPEYGLYPSEVEFLPVCTKHKEKDKDKEEAEKSGCAKQVPTLIVRGTFTKANNPFGAKDDDSRALWVGVWLDNETEMHRFRVKEREFLGAGSTFAVIRGKVKIQESEGFVFSEDGAQSKTLKVSVLDQNGNPVYEPQVLTPGFIPFSYWTPRCIALIPKKIPQAMPQFDMPRPQMNEQPAPFFDPCLPEEEPPPTITAPPPSAPKPPSLLELWLTAHQGELLACQLSSLLMLFMGFCLRKVSSRVVVVSLLFGGGLLGSALVFLVVDSAMPIYAHDLSEGPENPLMRGVSFALMFASVLMLFFSRRFLTPSLDHTERRFFQMLGWLLMVALGTWLWSSNLWLSALWIFGAVFSALGCLFVSMDRSRWLAQLKVGEVSGLVVAPRQEHPSEGFIPPVFCGSEDLCDLVVLQASTEEGPYRNQQKPLWLMSSHPSEQNLAQLRIAVCAAVMGLFVLAGLVALFAGS